MPDSELFGSIQQRSIQHCAESARGDCLAFFDSNIQVEWVHVDNIPEYDAAFLPYPVMLKRETARKLTEYVRGGGKLSSEGLPGYFGDAGHAGQLQPNLGLDALFWGSRALPRIHPAAGPPVFYQWLLE